ncbi:MAG: 4'-phosphopantetheinyl transferase superfamily protein [Pyrinomonadaceae bacterium]
MDARQQPWLDAPESPLLADGEVHVWRARLLQDERTLGELWDTLSADERERAERFHFRRDRDRFIAARGALRNLLGRYAGVAPRLLRFSYDSYGKPSLCGEAGGASLRFNASHSNDLALFALTRGREVGVDLEFVREDFASFEIAEHFFSPGEVEALRALAPDVRAVAFFDCWTRKEAYIKARGEGLSHPLHLFTVSLGPGEDAALLRTDDDPLEAARWTLVELFPGEGARAALAVEAGSSPPRLRIFEWQAAL